MNDRERIISQATELEPEVMREVSYLSKSDYHGAYQAIPVENRVLAYSIRIIDMSGFADGNAFQGDWNHARVNRCVLSQDSAGFFYLEVFETEDEAVASLESVTE